MKVAPWMPEQFEFQQNYPGGQQAYEQSTQQAVQDWQGGQYGTKPRAEAQILTQYTDPQQTGLGGLFGNKNLRDLLIKQRDPFGGPRQHPFIQGPPRGSPWQDPQGGYPGRPKPLKPQYDVAGGFEEFGETLGGYKETLGGYGEQLGGFGETLGGYGEQISGFEEQLGGFGEQFSGIEEQVGGVGEDINEINERLGGIEEGISTLKISKPEQKQNPYANMFNPFSFIGNWGGSRSRMSYR
jgi:hypothetical protein